MGGLIAARLATVRARTLCALVAIFVASGCSGAEPPVLDALAERTVRRPLILVPGVTGASLRDVASGEMIWGRGKDLLFPKDGGYAVARPLSTDVTGDSGDEAVAVIEQIRVVGVIRRDIYGPLARLVAANGYRRGDLEAPRSDADFFMFAYDWRDDLVASTRRLAELLEGVRKARGVPVLEVDLICQSAGGQICRYLAKYGGAALEVVERGGVGPPDSLRVAKAILIGTANGGSTRIVRELHRGRTYVPKIGRKMQPEVLFSFASLFQDLPVYRQDLFIDPEGRPLEIDLFDPQTWLDYEMSIFSRESRKRVEKSARTDLFGDESEWRRSLERFLDRSRRLHAVLMREVDGFSSRYYSIQNVDDATPDRIVVRPDGEGRAEFLFTGDRALEKMAPLHQSVTTGGDGHAALESQNWLTPQERAAMASDPLHIDGDHFKMILDPRAETRILDYLADE